MSLHLKKFETTSQYEQYVGGPDLILPNVSLCDDTNAVHYNPYDPYNGHEYVEIGGLKWATMNVGATAVTDNGLYFQWGDTQGYTAEQVGNGEGQKNFKANADGTYTFYVSKTSQGDVYIAFTGEGGGDDPDPQPVVNPPYVMHSATPADDESWTKVSLVQNPGNEGEYMGSLELAANEEFVFEIANGDWRNFNKLKSGSASEVVQGTVNTNNFKASAAGTYTFYVEKAEGGQVYIAYSNGEEPVTPEKVTLTVTNVPSWVGNNDAVIFAHVWGGSAGDQWILATLNGTTVTFDADSDITGFQLVRCYKGTTTPSWSTAGDVVGRIYNKSQDFTISGSVTTYNDGQDWAGNNP